MPVVRIYVPVGRLDLTELADSGSLSAGPGTPREAFAVTEALTAGAPGLDEEDLEYAAFIDAVAAAGRARTAAADRRVVVAADADPSWVTRRDGRPVSRVSLVAPVPVSRVAAFHIDEFPGVVEAESGDQASGDTSWEAPRRTADEADELLWYDVTEIDEVRALLG